MLLPVRDTCVAGSPAERHCCHLGPFLSANQQALHAAWPGWGTAGRVHANPNGASTRGRGGGSRCRWDRSPTPRWARHPKGRRPCHGWKDLG